MFRTVRRLALVLAFAAAVPTLAAAQSGEAVIQQHGKAPVVEAPTYAVPRDVVYKVAYDVNVGPEKAEDVVDGFRRPAQFLLQADANGVPRQNVKLALIVYGTAARSLLTNDAYRAATGKDNASVALLQALHDAGVEIIVCGQALINRNVPRGQLLPYVKVATSATIARVALHAQGYETFDP